MPDETNSPSPTPATNAAPGTAADARANAARFEQLRQALEEEYLECEARLISIRKGLSDLPTNWPPAANQPPAAPPESSGVVQDFLNLFLAPVETFKRVMSGLPGATSSPVAAPAKVPPQVPATNSPALPAPATNPPGGINGTNAVAPPPQSYQLPQSSPGSPGSEFSTADRVASPGAGNFVEPDSAASAASASGGQSAALQISAGRVLGALEQNSQMSISIFNQLADAVAGQNRALDEVNRKISQLAGQINSLKNP